MVPDGTNGGAEFDFLAWDICGYEKVVEGFEAYH